MPTIWSLLVKLGCVFWSEFSSAIWPDFWPHLSPSAKRMVKWGLGLIVWGLLCGVTSVPVTNRRSSFGFSGKACTRNLGFNKRLSLGQMAHAMADPCSIVSDDDPYRILGLHFHQKSALSSKKISKAYRELSLKCHPDRRKNVSKEKAHQDYVERQSPNQMSVLSHFKKLLGIHCNKVSHFTGS